MLAIFCSIVFVLDNCSPALLLASCSMVLAEREVISVSSPMDVPTPLVDSVISPDREV